MKIREQLIESCIKEDRKAQEELYKLCFASLISICYRFSNNKDDAAILLNAAFFKVLKNLEKQNPDIPFMAWASRITVNHCISEYRKNNTRTKHVTTLDEDGIAKFGDVDELDVNKKDISPETMKKVRTEILNLPPTTQEVFQLYIFQNCTHKEVADLLEIKEGTSKWHLNNARKILRSVLSETRKLMSSIAL